MSNREAPGESPPESPIEPPSETPPESPQDTPPASPAGSAPASPPGTPTRSPPASSTGPPLASPGTAGEEPEMVNMFASVWVKVEVEEMSGNETDEAPRTRSRKKKQRNPRRLTQKMKCDFCDYTTVYKNCYNLHIMSHTESKPLSCDYCSYTTKYPTSLQRHILIQHEFKQNEEKYKDLPIHKCDQCKYTTYFKWNLNAHRRKHNLEKQFKCPVCDYATAYRHNYLKHSKTHSKHEIEYKCDKCPFMTKYEGHISRHLAKIHNEVSEKANKCDFCDFSTKIRWRLNIHKQRSKQAAPIKCAYCDFESIYMCESKRHKVSHYKEIYGSKKADSYDASKSGNPTTLSNLQSDQIKASNGFSNSSTDNGNRSNDYGNGSNNFSNPTKRTVISHNFGNRSHYNHELNDNFNRMNDVGNRQFDYGNQSTDHSNSLNDIGNQPDDYQPTDGNKLGSSYMTGSYDMVGSSQMNPDPEYASEFHSSHEKSNHYTMDPNCEIDWHNIQVTESSNKEKPFKCNMCKYTSRFKASVQRHFQRHHTGNQNRPYKCVNCDFSTKTKDQISLHNKRSQSDIELFCKQCDFVCNFKCQYVLHQKSHNTHKCTLCSYSSRQKYDMQKHYTIMHLGSGLKCRFCDYKATRRESLTCHETIHTGNKPFKCTKCDYASVRKSLLDNHLKRYHSDALRNEVVIVKESKIESLKIKVSQSEKEHNDNIQKFIESTGLRLDSQGIVKMGDTALTNFDVNSIVNQN